MTDTAAWPEIPVAGWIETRDTLHLWTQIVGKVRLENTPLISHWWNVPLYVTARGFTTGLVPHGSRNFQVDFDFVDHRLDTVVDDGSARSFDLAPMSVAAFYRRFMADLDDLGLSTSIWTTPVEIPGTVEAFDQDETHTSYDADAVHRYWRALTQVDRVFEEFRGRFLGKMSPVHLFWGALDIAVSRFSGRPAPPHPGGAPNCGPHVMLEAYSREVSSAGFWPGPDGEGTFYSYAYPEPSGFRDATVAPAGAYYDVALGEFLLPYTAVRTAKDPDAVLLEFLQTTYDAAADLARWDRAALERAR